MLIQNRRGRLQRRQKCNRGSAKVAAAVLKDVLRIAASPSFALPAKPAFHTMLRYLALPAEEQQNGKGAVIRLVSSSRWFRSASSQAPRNAIPVCLPDMDGLRVCDPIVHGLLIQQVKEIFDCQRDRAVGTEDHLEQVIHKLLQSALWRTKQDRVSTGRGEWRAQAPRR